MTANRASLRARLTAGLAIAIVFAALLRPGTVAAATESGDDAPKLCDCLADTNYVAPDPGVAPKIKYVSATEGRSPGGTYVVTRVDHVDGGVQGRHHQPPARADVVGGRRRPLGLQPRR